MTLCFLQRHFQNISNASWAAALKRGQSPLEWRFSIHLSVHPTDTASHGSQPVSQACQPANHDFQPTSQASQPGLSARPLIQQARPLSLQARPPSQPVRQALDKGTENLRVLHDLVRYDKTLNSSREDYCKELELSKRSPSSFQFLGSGPDRGRSPVEWGDFPSVRPSVRPYVGPSPPSRAQEPARQALDPASQASEPGRQAQSL